MRTGWRSMRLKRSDRARPGIFRLASSDTCMGAAPGPGRSVDTDSARGWSGDAEHTGFGEVVSGLRAVKAKVGSPEPLWRPSRPTESQTIEGYGHEWTDPVMFVQRPSADPRAISAEFKTSAPRPEPRICNTISGAEWRRTILDLGSSTACREDSIEIWEE